MPLATPRTSHVLWMLALVVVGASHARAVHVAIDGDGAAGDAAHLYDGAGKTVLESTTDPAGALDADLAPGVYSLWLESGPLFRDLAVEEGEGAQTLELTLPPSCSLRGKLTLADGRPAAGYIVAVQSGVLPTEDEDLDDPATWAPGALTCYRQAKTGPDGEFALDGLARGTIALDLRLPGEPRPVDTIWDVALTPEEPLDLGTMQVSATPWRYLFDGHSLDGWKLCDYFGQNEVLIEDGAIVLTHGNDMTGVVYGDELPTMNYELTLQGRRVESSDFFCGLTFPVEDSSISLILGGWGGGVVGLSSLDGADASENETSTWRTFVEGQWYRVRVVVEPERIRCWLDDKPLIDVSTVNRDVGVRWEMERCLPLGLATWRTTGAIRDLRIRERGGGAE